MHASLGSRTPNIRKKNRRSQKQRTTLRNKRNARAKVGGVLPQASYFLNTFKKTEKSPELTLEEQIEIINKKLRNEQTSADRDLLERQYFINQANIAAAREEEEKERVRTQAIEDSDRENYYQVIEPMLNHIYKRMSFVENSNDARQLFEAAEELITHLSQNRRNEVKKIVMEAWNIQKDKHNLPEFTTGGWYYTDEPYLNPSQIENKKDKFDPYVYPPDILQDSEVKMQHFEKMNQRRRQMNP